MNKKKYISLITALLLLITCVLAGCGTTDKDTGKDNQQDQPPANQASETINVVALAGPTGMGMSQLSTLDWYDVTVLQSPDEAVAKVVNGEADIAAMPSNMGAVLSKKTEGAIQVLAINTLGVLYIVENGNTVKSLQDLKGKTVIGSGQGGVPEYAFKKILTDAGIDPENDVTIQWLSSHADVATSLMATEGAIALLPEPQVTVVTAKNDKINVAININQVWKETVKTDLPMGVIVAQKSFVEERASDLEVFLADYDASVKFTNNSPSDAAKLIVEAGIVADAAVAEKAIPGSQIVFITGEEMKTTLENFYQVLFESNPGSVGGSLPDENYYYIS